MPARYLLNRKADLKDYEPPKGIVGAYINTAANYSTTCGGNTASVKKMVKQIRTALRRRKEPVILPDYFVGLGTSGAVLVSVLSYEFDVRFIHIRKAKIGRHAHTIGELDDAFVAKGGATASVKQPLTKVGQPNNSEGINWNAKDVYKGKTFWFVDDCIASGLTFRQTLHMATIDEGMRLTGVVLTAGGISDIDCRKWAFLSKTAPLTIFGVC